jgi:DNA gyrase subunit A
MGRTALSSWNFFKDDTDEVIGMITVDKDAVNDTQVVTENGYGKRLSLLMKMVKM